MATLTSLAVDYVEAPHDESWSEDSMGYFVIRATKKGLRVEHYKDGLPDAVITGDLEDIRKYILRRWPEIQVDHYGYVCQELGRASEDLQAEMDYVQL
jgi:hypothetical protein